jgi:hypothetical protein
VSLTQDQDTKDKDGWTESACRKSREPKSRSRHLIFTDLDILSNELWAKGSETPELPQISIAKKAHDAKVLICTGMNDRPSEGLVSAISSFTKGSESTSFQELWTVKLKQSSLGEKIKVMYLISCSLLTST